MSQKFKVALQVSKKPFDESWSHLTSAAMKTFKIVDQTLIVRHPVKHFMMRQAQMHYSIMQHSWNVAMWTFFILRYFRDRWVELIITFNCCHGRLVFKKSLSLSSRRSCPMIFTVTCSSLIVAEVMWCDLTAGWQSFHSILSLWEKLTEQRLSC